MKITFADHEFLLHPSGILFWPEKSMAIVSDLHLEKGSYFAQKGFFLPPYDTHETLERLHKALAVLTPKQILILGDTFHDAKGHGRLPAKERVLFDRLLHYAPFWITGNHDGDFVPEGFTPVFGSPGLRIAEIWQSLPPSHVTITWPSRS